MFAKVFNTAIGQVVVIHQRDHDAKSNGFSLYFEAQGRGVVCLELSAEVPMGHSVEAFFDNLSEKEALQLVHRLDSGDFEAAKPYRALH